MVMFCRYWLAVETQPVPYGMLSQDSCCKVFMVIRPMWWGGEGHLSIAKSIYPKFSDILNLHSFSRHVTPYHFSLHLQWYWQGEFVWNLVTSSLDRNPINLRCACGTCAETVKKRARLHERTAMSELGLVMYSLCFTKRGRPVLVCHC